MFDFKSQLAHWNNSVGFFGVDPRHIRTIGHPLITVGSNVYSIPTGNLWYDVTNLFVNERIRQQIGYYLYLIGSNANIADVQWKINNVCLCSHFLYYGGVFPIYNTKLQIEVRNSAGATRALTGCIIAYLPKNYYNDEESIESWNVRNNQERTNLKDFINGK